MGATKAPATPDPNKAYAEGIQTNIQYAPQLAAAEYALRGQYDGASVADTIDREREYGGTGLSLYQGLLNSVDPGASANTAQTAAVRAQLGNQVGGDLALGTRLDPGVAREEEQAVRVGQAARGNTLGNAPISVEALNKGNAGERLYQQRLQNAGNFAQGDNSLQQLTGIASLVSGIAAPDRSFSYVNPASGAQGQNTALQFYQAALGSGAGAGANPWTSSLSTAAGLAAVGVKAYGGYGGSAAGGTYTGTGG